MNLVARGAEPLTALARGTAATYGRLTAAQRMLPQFLICGAQRGGTTSLFQTLARHPDVLPPAFTKGVHYFDSSTNYARGAAWYRGHFPIRSVAALRARSGRSITGEASPYYMFHPLAAARIARDLPEAQVVVLLRDPVERAYSAHKQETGRGFETETFERALALEDERLEGEEERIRSDPCYDSFHHQHHAYRRRGYYATQLERLFHAVGRERVLILETERVFADDGTSWNVLLHHLGLASWRPRELPRVNARPSAGMPAPIRRGLELEFASRDADLARLLGHQPAWREDRA